MSEYQTGHYQAVGSHDHSNRPRSEDVGYSCRVLRTSQLKKGIGEWIMGIVNALTLQNPYIVHKEALSHPKYHLLHRIVRSTLQIVSLIPGHDVVLRRTAQIAKARPLLLLLFVFLLHVLFPSLLDKMAERTWTESKRLREHTLAFPSFRKPSY